MKRRTKVVLSLLALAVVAAGIGRVLVARKAAPAQSSAAPKAAAALELASADLVSVRMGELTRTLQVSGSLVAVNSAFVKARVAAEVKTVAVREGDSVRAGQVLAQLDTTEFDWRLRQAEQQAQAARAQLDIAQRALQNNKALVAQGFISATVLDNAVSTEAGAQATLQAALAGMELARKARADATLSAPIAGQISQRLVQPGERVPVDAKLLEIVDLSRLELQASVAPEDAGQLRVGATARLFVDGIDGEVPARVVRINPSAQAGSRSVLAYLALQPNPGLRQGLFARGMIELERRRALILPLSVLRSDQALPYVLKLDGAVVTQRVLRTGMRGQAGPDDVVEVLEGLSEGESVLAGSVGAVRDGTRVRVANAQASSQPITPTSTPVKPQPSSASASAAALAAASAPR
ncbi:MAG: efflux RND transporter periplasmic adaptor subunit [Rubrivivax sp.]